MVKTSNRKISNCKEKDCLQTYDEMLLPKNLEVWLGSFPPQASFYWNNN